MRLLLFNAPNTLNYGSMMMAEALLFHLSKALEDDLEAIFVTGRPQETIERLTAALPCPGLSVKAIAPGELVRGSRLEQLSRFLSGVGSHQLFSPVLDTVDAVVVLGGDDYTVDTSLVSLPYELSKFQALARLGKKVAMLSQTMGPFTPWKEPLYSWMLRGLCGIWVREPLTQEYLTRALHLPNVHLSADLAFLSLARQHEQWAALPEDPYITVVPSELIWRYALERDREAYLEALVEAVATIASRVAADCRVVVLPHVLAPEHSDDRLAARDLEIGLRRRGLDEARLIVIDKPLLPFEARALLRGGLLTLTGRMHAAVSSFATGVPAVSLAYSRKYHGIIGQYLGLEDLVVDVTAMPWREAGLRCVEVFEHAWSQREVLGVRIGRRVAELQAAASEGLTAFRTLCLDTRSGD